MKYYFLAFKNIFNFKDEATIKEFWYYFLINIVVTVIVNQVCKKFELNEYVFSVYRVITVFALISLGFRRLKDAGLSGWLFLIPLVNLILAGLPRKRSQLME